jgi:sterol desaturase/sphingolipid hydroxylase (fatty acid hydroxylase superfamily)
MSRRTLLDYATFPAFVIVPLLAAWLLLERGVPNLLVTPIVVGVLAGVALLLERWRPERRARPRDLSLVTEAAHFVFNFELGYGLALLASAGLERGLRVVMAPMWPSSLPIALQLLWAVTLYEATSYWQHRLFHRRARLWAFHALHHFGERLDIFRAGRFHFVDFSTVAFIAYLPLVVLGTPEDGITLLAVLVSALGLAHHGNFRTRTPTWLDWLVCTPAVHRLHHSRVWQQSNANFANTVMIFDVLFGTYAKPHPVGPERMGIDEQLPAGFWAQLASPFAAERRSVTAP